MNRKLEEKVLEILKERVFERDNELKRKRDTTEVRQATKEALTEITSLSGKQVDEIAQQVHDEVYGAYARKRKWIIITFVALAFIGFIVLWPLLTREPPYKFVDSFDNTDAGWTEIDDYRYKREIKEGAYMYSVNYDEGWQKWDAIPIKLPENYTIQLTSRWISGAFDGYGLMLFQDKTNYTYYKIRADGYARHGALINDEWATENLWVKGIVNEGNGSITNDIKVVVRGQEVSFLINGEQIDTGHLHGLDIASVAVSATGKQTVAFEHLSIKDDNTGQVLMDDSFDDNQTGWKPEEDYQAKSEWGRGELQISQYRKGYCDWSKIPIPYQLSSKYKISLKAHHIKGETGTFGLMLGEDNSNYLAFEVNTDGTGRILERYDGEFTFVGDYIKAPYDGEPYESVNVRLEVDNADYVFFINGKQIGTWNNTNITVYRLGIRVCDRQTVAFTHIEIEDL